MKIKDILKSNYIPNLIFILGWSIFAIISILQIIALSISSLDPESVCKKCDSSIYFLILLVSNLFIFIIYFYLFLKLKKRFFINSSNVKNKYKILFTCFLLICLYIAFFYFIFGGLIVVIEKVFM